LLCNIITTKFLGGLADKKQPSDFDKKALKKGINVEFEHTNDIMLAAEIAMDHLSEDESYYDKLEKVEGEIFIRETLSLSKFKAIDLNDDEYVYLEGNNQVMKLKDLFLEAGKEPVKKKPAPRAKQVSTPGTEPEPKAGYKETPIDDKMSDKAFDAMMKKKASGDPEYYMPTKPKPKSASKSKSKSSDKGKDKLPSLASLQGKKKSGKTKPFPEPIDMSKDIPHAPFPDPDHMLGLPDDTPDLEAQPWTDEPEKDEPFPEPLDFPPPLPKKVQNKDSGYDEYQTRDPSQKKLSKDQERDAFDKWLKYQEKQSKDTPDVPDFKGAGYSPRKRSYSKSST
jgi:hypothetical protein